MNSEISIKTPVITYEYTEVEVVKTAYIPIWVNLKTNCDICGFSFREYPNTSEDTTMMALKTKRDGNLYIHPECMNRATKKDED